MNIKQLSTIFITCYYLVLASLVAVKVVETVFTGSVLINKGAKVAELKQEKQNLLKAKQRLEEQLASAESLANLDQTQLAAYSPIAEPIILEIPSTVALR